MLVYHPNFSLKLDQYGIGVPLKNSRDQKTFEYLKNLFPELVNMTLLEDFPELTTDDLMAVHEPSFINALFLSSDSLGKQIYQAYELENYGIDIEEHNYQELLETILLHCRGALLALKRAYCSPDKFSYLLGGGMHHAMSFGGRGFCLLNDGVIALEKMKKEFHLKNVWVIDVDAHKGDGTAELAQSRPWLHTLSLHMGSSWPFGQPEENENSPWFIPSDLDITFEIGEESEYLSRLKKSLGKMLELFGTPDLVWVVAGADVYEHDELLSAKGINLTQDQVLSRDMMIYEFLKSLSVPQAWCLAGGYGERTWEIPSQFLKTLMLALRP